MWVGKGKEVGDNSIFDTSDTIKVRHFGTSSNVMTESEPKLENECGSKSHADMSDNDFFRRHKIINIYSKKIKKNKVYNCFFE